MANGSDPIRIPHRISIANCSDPIRIPEKNKEIPKTHPTKQRNFDSSLILAWLATRGITLSLSLFLSLSYHDSLFSYIGTHERKNYPDILIENPNISSTQPYGIRSSFQNLARV